MEGRDIGTACATETTRWNPTKEQINMLENFYRQGIRTPSADQIQQITRRLKAYGSIQGKNVFYWFQNHKARQRQKHNLPPPPPAPNVVCEPYFLPEGDIGLYPQIQCPAPEVLLHGGVKRRGRPEKTGKPSFDGGAACDLVRQDYNTMLPGIESHEGVLNHDDHETLALFPLHPTGVLERRETLMSPFDSTSGVGNSTITPSSCETSAGIDGYCSGTRGGQHYFDFFSCHGSS